MFDEVEESNFREREDMEGEFSMSCISYIIYKTSDLPFRFVHELHKIYTSNKNNSNFHFLWRTR